MKRVRWILMLVLLGPAVSRGESPDLAVGVGEPAVAVARISAEREARIAELQARFDDWERSSWPDFVVTSLSSGKKVRDLYLLEDALAGYANMFEATGERRYLERALTLVRNTITVHPWTRPNGSRWWHEDMKAALSTGRLCRLGRSDGLEVDDVVRFLDEEILGYHLLERPFGGRDRGIDWAMTVHLTDPPTKEAGYWSGFQTLAARIAWDLHQLGVERWSAFATFMSSEFEKRVEFASDGAALWDIGRVLHGESLAHAPDTGHYNRTVRWMLQVDRDGGLDGSLVAGLAATFVERIYQPRHGTPYLVNYIDGQDLAYGKSPPGSGYLHDGWLLLGEGDPRVQEAGEAVYDLVRTSPSRKAVYFIHARPTSRLALVSGLAVNERRRSW